VHVSQPAIRANLKKHRQGEKSYDPVITVKHGQENIYGHEVLIKDDNGKVIARLIQPRDEQLSCGARVWLECQDSNLEIREHKQNYDIVTDFE